MNERYVWPTVSFPAMGSDFGLWLDASPAHAEAAFAEAIALIDELEHCMSRFLPDSELNRLNRSNGRAVTVSPTLYTVVEQAVTMAWQTDGRFDPTLLADLNRVGYDRTIDNIRDRSDAPPAASSNRRQRQWEGIVFEPDTSSVLLPAGTGIDLGGIGKGYTAQIVAKFLSETGPCLVDAGGDIVAGEAPAGYAGWPVTIAAPLNGAGSPADDIIGFWLTDAALTTSGVDRRRWTRGGETYHHLLDPTTRVSAASPLVTVSVLAQEGSTAEALSTAALVAGPEEGSRLIQAMGAGGLLVTDQGRCILAGTFRHEPFWQIPVKNVLTDNGVFCYEF